MAAGRGYPIALIGGRGGVAVRTLECLQRKHPALRGWAEEGPEFQIKSTNLQIYKSTNVQDGLSQQHSNRAIEQSDEEITDQYFVELAEKIRKTNTRIVFVGLGAPKQEFFIERLALSLRDPASWRGEAISQKTRSPRTKKLVQFFSARDDKRIVFMSVGGSFDIISGRTPRAPRAMQAVHLEWLWRLIRQPWRFQRQLALLKFFWLVVRKKLASKG